MSHVCIKVGTYHDTSDRHQYFISYYIISVSYLMNGKPPNLNRRIFCLDVSALNGHNCEASSQILYLRLYFVLFFMLEE